MGFACLLVGQNSITEIQSISINPGEKITLIGDDRLKNDDHTVHLNGNLILNLSTHKIIQVGMLGVEDPQNIAVFSINEIKQGPNNYVMVHMIQEGQTVGDPWTIPLDHDAGIPSVKMIRNQIVLLKPETQSYEVYSPDGSDSKYINLFNNRRMNHELILLHLQGNDNHYLLGMRSPELSAVDNTVLFQLKSDMNPEPVIELPMTIPYLGAISPKNSIAVLGTRKHSTDFRQLPLLIIGSLDDPGQWVEVTLDKMPRDVFWHKNKIYLIFKDHLEMGSGDDNYRLVKKYFPNPFFPVKSLSTNNTIQLIGSPSLDISESGMIYSGVSFIKYDSISDSFTQKTLTKVSSKILRVLQGNNQNELFIQLDKQFIQFRVEQ